jgi:hypothetical protein
VRWTPWSLLIWGAFDPSSTEILFVYLSSAVCFKWKNQRSVPAEDRVVYARLPRKLPDTSLSS